MLLLFHVEIITFLDDHQSLTNAYSLFPTSLEEIRIINIFPNPRRRRESLLDSDVKLFAEDHKTRLPGASFVLDDNAK
jgi:hypothetical protein